MKSFVFCLMSFVLATVASAQGLQLPRRTLGSRLQRPDAAASQPQPSASTSDSASAESGEAPAFNWDAAPVDIVLQAYGERTGKTILKDPQVPAATITLKSRAGQKLTNEEYLEAIETVLEMNQIHLEPYGESFIRALPRKDVRKEGIPLIMDPEAKIGDTGKVVSMIIQLKNISPEEAQKILDEFKSGSGKLIALERTSSIIVTDTEQNINRMLEVVKSIDVFIPSREELFIRQIKNTEAQKVYTALQKLVDELTKLQTERNGKAAVMGTQPNQSAQSVRPLLGGLRRPGQAAQPAAPANNESMFISMSSIDRDMISGPVIMVVDDSSNRIIFYTSKSNMDRFDKLIENLDVETIPDTIVKVYRLKYAEAEEVSDMINDLIGSSASSKNSGNQNLNAKQGTNSNLSRGTQSPQKKPANQRTGEAKAGELNKENTTVLADKRINGLVVMTMKELVPTIEQIIESMDIKLSQVLIETVIIEVGLGDDLNWGMDWIQKGRQAAQLPDTSAKTLGANGLQMFNYTNGKGEVKPHEDVGTSFVEEIDDTTSETWTRIGDGLTTLIPGAKYVDRTGLMNNWRGATSVGLSGGGGVNDLLSGVLTNGIAGKGLNFVFNSDELGLAAVLQATKTDSRAKYVASPIIMTLDNKEATVDATKKQQFLTGWTAQSGSYAGVGQPTPNYSSEDIGIKLKVTPKINPNGTVLLTVEESYSQVSEKQYILTPVATGAGSGYTLEQTEVPSKREMSADVLLENNQTVVFTGLTETRTTESEEGIPFLKDIPLIGKWLFSKVETHENRIELLVFMTPYVLDDAQAAQVEALRRKKTLSDPRPWEDHGWSLSPLADPVSKQEQMRRIKEEWRKQDEERRTKIAIEKAKVERVKKLEKMSQEEREMWLKMHKEELDDEAQDELEEKMLDEKSQEELKKLAAQIRKEKLGAAEKAIKTAEDEAAAENERGKLDAAKKAKEEAKKGE